MEKLNAIFLCCLDNELTRVNGGVMLPYTHHIPNFNKNKFKASIYDLLSVHQKFIDVGYIQTDVESNNAFILPNRKRKLGNPLQLFKFNHANHRFKPTQLESPPSAAQSAYLESKIITHAWVAIDKGLIVGVIFYPIFENHTPNNPEFMTYKSKARVLLKTIGYPIAGDFVIDKNGRLRFYRVFNHFQSKYKNESFKTQEIGLPKFLRNGLVNTETNAEA